MVEEDFIRINLSYDGGGSSKCPPLFLFVKTIEKVIRLCTVLNIFFLSGSFEDKAIFHLNLEIIVMITILELSLFLNENYDVDQH